VVDFGAGCGARVGFEELGGGLAGETVVNRKNSARLVVRQRTASRRLSERFLEAFPKLTYS
jgi:hypothetical protein